jgi:hypothetical protein
VAKASTHSTDSTAAIAAVDEATARLVAAVDAIRGSGPGAFAAPSL